MTVLYFILKVENKNILSTLITAMTNPKCIEVNLRKKIKKKKLSKHLIDGTVKNLTTYYYDIIKVIDGNKSICRISMIGNEIKTIHQCFISHFGNFCNWKGSIIIQLIQGEDVCLTKGIDVEDWCSIKCPDQNLTIGFCNMHQLVSNILPSQITEI